MWATRNQGLWLLPCRWLPVTIYNFFLISIYSKVLKAPVVGLCEVFCMSLKSLLKP
jgi:hypothetical protein